MKMHQNNIKTRTILLHWPGLRSDKFILLSKPSTRKRNGIELTLFIRTCINVQLHNDGGFFFLSIDIY